MLAPHAGTLPTRTLLLTALIAANLPGQTSEEADPLRRLQEAAVADRDEQRQRIFAWGDHGLDGVFATHASHSNRLVPAIVYSPFASLELQRNVAETRSSEGQPEHSERIDQTQLHTMLLDSVDRGAKRVVVLLLDGADWHVYAAASAFHSGTWQAEGYGEGLAWFDREPMPGTRKSMAAAITSPLRYARVPGGYDAEAGGTAPWSEVDRTYLKGVAREGGPRPHAVTDSSASATSIFSGIKTLNGRVGVYADGTPAEPLGRTLQRRGFAVATVTDVPFDHASPAAVYASAEDRGDYAGSIGPQMLGLGEWPGLDIVLGYGFSAPRDHYLSAEHLTRIESDRAWRTVTSASGGDRERLAEAARSVGEARAAGRLDDSRLFGFFGTPRLAHAPYRTADGRYDPTPGLGRNGVAPPETYGERERELPRLVDLAGAAMSALEATPERPFLLFVEAGLVDWSQHANNLDHCVGEVLSAEETFVALFDWITRNGWWHETTLLVTSDHGHLLQADFAALRAAAADGR